VNNAFAASVYVVSVSYSRGADSSPDIEQPSYTLPSQQREHPLTATYTKLAFDGPGQVISVDDVEVGNNNCGADPIYQNVISAPSLYANVQDIVSSRNEVVQVHNSNL